MRTGDDKQARAMRAKLTERQLERVDALPYGDAFTTDDALDALEAEVAKQRQAKPGWRLPQLYTMLAPWRDPKWRAGSWVAIRTGFDPSTQAMRSRMTERQRERLDALPYGLAFTTDDALDALEAEVTKQRQTNPRWRLTYTYKFEAPWGEPEWKAGSWVSGRRGSSQQAQQKRKKLTERQRDRFEALPYGDAFTTDQALDALEAEAARQRHAKPDWLIPAKYEMEAPWDPKWKAGMWVSIRSGAGQQQQATRSNMTERQRERVDALPYGRAFTIDDALDALEAEAAQQRQAKPGWRLTQTHTMVAPWGDPKWRAGSWVAMRTGDDKQARAMRAKLTERQLERVDALPYGDAFTTDDALDALEAEVAKQRQAKPGWRMPAKHEMVAPWGDPKWKAGAWVARNKGATDQARAARAKMTDRQRERIDALPFGAEEAFTTDDALDALEAEVTRKRQEQPGWRMKASHEMAAPWGDSVWKAGIWVAGRFGAKSSLRAKMTERQRQRLDALPYGYITTDQALDALEAEVAKQQRATPGWQMPWNHVMKAPWGDPKWTAGSWMNSRSGDGEAQRKRRADMTPRQRERLDALPYGR